MGFSLNQLLENKLQESFLFTPFLGINVSIIDERLGSWNSAYGLSDPKTRHSFALNSSCYIYSITKTFAAVTLLKLLEQNKLDLDASVQEYFHEFDIDKRITSRHLLNHTSGIVNYTELENYVPDVRNNPGSPWPEIEIVKLIESHDLDFAPGTSWHYSNTAYFVIKKLIELLSGLSFAQAIELYITKPLNLAATFVVQDISKDCLTPGFSRELHPNRSMERVDHKYHPGWCYTGLIISTSEDTVKFYHSLFSGEVLTQAQLAMLTEPVSIGSKEAGFGDPNYGLGIMIDKASEFGGLMYAHGGQGPGYNPWVMHLPDFFGRAVSIAVFANTAYGIVPRFLLKDIVVELQKY